MSKTVSLGDIINLKRGYDLPSSQRKPGKFPIISSSGVSDYHIGPKVKGPGVVTGRYGTLGKAFYVEGDFWPLNTTLYVEDFRGNNPKYISYLLDSLKLNNENIAGAVPGVNRNFLHKIKVPYVDKILQNKIVEIIGSIDEKIELNRRMNETLEQMGQALFRHHFITNPTAKEWGKIPLGRSIHPHRGKSLTSSKMAEGNVWVISGGLQPAGKHNEANTEAPVITVSASGANAGYVALWGENVWSADSSFIDTNVTDNVYFYYVFLKLNQGKIYGMQTGAAQPHIYPSHLELLEMPNVPSEQITSFNLRVTPLFKQIARNTEEIQTLTTLRNILLPRLISGKIQPD